MKILQRIFSGISNFLSGLAGIFGQREGPRWLCPDYDEEDKEEDFSLPHLNSAAEVRVFMAAPPVTINKKTRIAPVSKSGQICASKELRVLTSRGISIFRYDYSLMDDHGALGKPERIAQCTSCKKFSFQNNPCAACGNSTCPNCGGEFEDSKIGSRRFLCNLHLKKAERKAAWSADNWAEYHTKKTERQKLLKENATKQSQQKSEPESEWSES